MCDTQEINISVKLPKLMILQDTSSSMVMEDGQPVEKWNQAKAALIKLVADFETKVAFGLDYFPDGSGFISTCGVNGPVISDAAATNAQTIIDHLNAEEPEGSTPLYNGMAMFKNPAYAPGFLADDANSYLLVVSDGADKCGIADNPMGQVNPETLGQLTTELLQDHDIKSFVIGFGDGVAPDELNAIAQNGGTDFTEYLIADDQASLEEALTAIVETLVSCTYTVEHPDDPMVDVDNVNFYFEIDGEEELVLYDADCAVGVGWTWRDPEHTIVEFCGEACETVESGKVDKILIAYGCEPITPE